MSEENTFGSLLKILRQKSKLLLARKGIGWTQKAVAEELGVSHRLYVGWENAESIPSQSDLKNIAALFSLDTEAEGTLYRAAARTPPRTHNLPLPQNPFFTGREAQLERLRQFLEGNGSVAVTHPVIISGLGGIGKTQLALEYAHKSYRDIYRAVFWVNAASEESLQYDYASLANLLKLPERQEDDIGQKIQAVKRWLEEYPDWLLIMDNADDLQLARPYLPVKPGGHILLTTRSQIVGTIGRRIEIDEMEPAEGLLFLLRRSGLVKDETEIATISSDVRETAARLVIILGGIPLALDQAGAYIEETGVSLADYIQFYKETRHFLLNRRGSSGNIDGDHPESIAATFELCFSKAREEQPMAEGILYLCSRLFPPGPTSDMYILSSFCVDPDTKTLIDAKTFNEVIAVLRRYSLVKRNFQEKTISIHPLVYAILRDTISPEAKMYWGERFPGTRNLRYRSTLSKSKLPFNTPPQ